jgi:hypothetical protein
MNAIRTQSHCHPNEVVMDCATRRKILRKVAPLAATAQDIHNPIHGPATCLFCSPLAAADLKHVAQLGLAVKTVELGILPAERPRAGHRC